MLLRMGSLSGQMGSAVPQLGGRWVSLARQASVLTEMGGSGWGCPAMAQQLWAAGGWSALPAWGRTAAARVPRGSRAAHWVPALP